MFDPHTNNRSGKHKFFETIAQHRVNGLQEIAIVLAHFQSVGQLFPFVGNEQLQCLANRQGKSNLQNHQ